MAEKRYYTVEEANAMLPAVRPLLERLRDLQQQLATRQAAAGRLQDRARTNGHSVKGEGLVSEIEAITAEIRQGLAQFSEWGIVVRDLSLGLIDFLGQRDGRDVWLCWHLGEERVAFWHEIDTGYRNRRPL